MNHQLTPVVEKQGPSLLDSAHVGMSVYDSTNEYIGTVTFVHLGAASPQELQRGAGLAGDLRTNEAGEHSFVGALTNAFSSEELPSEISDRLRQHGFIRIDSSGLFASDRFASAEQISSVVKEEVHLNVVYDQLAATQ
jgi:hypothetical protein